MTTTAAPGAAGDEAREAWVPMIAIALGQGARILALRIGLLLMAAVALPAIFPAGNLPAYRPGRIPAHPEPASPQELAAAAAEAEGRA